MKFFLGLAFGLLCSISYVRWGITKPEILDLMDTVQGSIISAATVDDLYDLDAPLDKRRRALEVMFDNSSKYAALIEAEQGYPYLRALYRRKVIKEARQLRIQWTAFDKALEKKSLRKVFETKYKTSDTTELKQAMLVDALERRPFLKKWIDKYEGGATPDTVLDLAKRLGRQPTPTFSLGNAPALRDAD